MIFKDRIDAGRQLASKLADYKNFPNGIVLGLPRGGVVVAKEIANNLNLAFDIEVPRKIGAPDNEELALGAIGEKGTGYFDEQLMQAYNLALQDLKPSIVKEHKELQRRLKTYRADKMPLDLRNKKVILVDDGIATGATMLAAIRSVKAKGAAKVIVAIPVSATDSLDKIRKEVDKVVYLESSNWLFAIGAFYESFDQVTDEEVIALLHAEG